MFISVDLPAPFSPTRAWISPARIDMEASWIATNWPKRLATLRITTRSGAVLSMPMPPG